MTRADLSRHLSNARQIAAIATAFTLPLSTTGQAISVTVLAVLSIELLVREPDRLIATLRRPQAYLPLALFGFLVIGLAWSIAPFAESVKWLGPYAKLLLIPLLMATAFSPRQVLQIGYGFLAGCLIVLVLSYSSMIWPKGPWSFFNAPGVPVKDNAVQSEVFALCSFGLLLASQWLWPLGRRGLAIVAIALAAAFFANMFFVYMSRTGLLVTLALLGLLIVRPLGWRRGLPVGIPVILILGYALSSLPSVQSRINEVSTGIQKPSTAPDAVSTATRVDYWKKAWGFVKAAPLLGHGTGSIRPLYQSLEATTPSPDGRATADPHNQFLHVALQIGLFGGLVLLAMWASHAWLFYGRDPARMFGLAILCVNVIGSLFNSHISQVTQGMLYCVAIGLLGAIVPATPVAARN